MCCLYRSRCRRLRKSGSPSCDRRKPTYYHRDHWKQESSHSPIVILRDKRSSNRKHCSLSDSPQRISELGHLKVLGFFYPQMYLYIYAFCHNNTIALQYTIYVIYKEYTFLLICMHKTLFQSKSFLKKTALCIEGN